MDYRARFVDAVGAVILELHGNTKSVAGVIELVRGIKWPEGAVSMVILAADGREVHSEDRRPGA